MTRTKIPATAGRPAVGSSSVEAERPQSPQAVPAAPSAPAGGRSALPGAPEAVGGPVASVVGDEVTVSWGEEKISPRPNSYSACTFGSIFYKTRVQPGETVRDAILRAYGIVRLMGENFRKEKLRSFLQALDEVAGGYKA